MFERTSLLINKLVFFSFFSFSCCLIHAIKFKYPPPVDMSPMGQSLWGLLITEPPLRQFGNSKNLNHFHSSENPWPEDFINHPEVQKRIKKGKKFHDSELVNIRKKIVELGLIPSTDRSMHKEAFLSLKRAQDELTISKIKNPYARINAQGIALKKLGLSSESELALLPHLRGRYERIVQKNIVPPLPRKKPKQKLADDEFIKWKKTFINNMVEKLRRANQEYFMAAAGHLSDFSIALKSSYSSEILKRFSGGRKETIEALAKLRFEIEFPNKNDFVGDENSIFSYRPIVIDEDGNRYAIDIIKRHPYNPNFSVKGMMELSLKEMPSRVSLLLMELERELSNLSTFFSDFDNRKQWMNMDNSEKRLNRIWS